MDEIIMVFKRIREKLRKKKKSNELKIEIILDQDELKRVLQEKSVLRQLPWFHHCLDSANNSEKIEHNPKIQEILNNFRERYPEYVYKKKEATNDE